jgi:hypothetical protein
METSDDIKPNFFKHVFRFDNDGKAELLNIIQYSLIAIIPVVILNKLMQKYVPEPDEEKGNVEILAEIIIQVIFIFVGLLIIHRTITYVPTYSGVNYPDFSVIFIILSVLMIVMSLQTKLGDKVSILVERISDLWNGTEDEKPVKKNKKGNVKVSQPISNNSQILPPPMQTQSYSDGTSIGNLPVNNQPIQQQQLPNYNNMYLKDTTPLVGAATPGQPTPQTQLENYSDMGNVVAASEFGGFGGFSSW